jgi:hypothetical protein
VIYDAMYRLHAIDWKDDELEVIKNETHEEPVRTNALAKN